jgi:hypothetical protein
MSNNSVKNAVLAIANQAILQDIYDQEVFKTVTVRVTVLEYARLKVISSYADISLSALAKLILSEGINDALEGVLESSYSISPDYLALEIEKEAKTLLAEVA